MKWFRKIKKYQRYFAAAFAMLVIALLFQNCGDIGIRTKSADFSSFSSFSKTTFPLPDAQSEATRVVFLVDMSVSMAHGLCGIDNAADSADLTSSCNAGVGYAAGTSLGIRPGAGIDNAGTRFEAMKKWINTLNENSKDPGSIKYMVIPFNGSEQIQGSDSKFLTGFVSSDTALGYVTDLEIWQNKSLEYYKTLQEGSSASQEMGQIGSASQGLKLSTTKPIARIAIAKDRMLAEAETLAASDTLTQFEVVVLSDGVPKPRSKHFKKAIRQFWKLNRTPGCIQQCGQIADNIIDGTNTTPGYSLGCSILDLRPWGADGVISYVTFSCFNLANNEVASGNFYSGDYVTQGMTKTGYQMIQEMKQYWGDPVENSPNKIALELLILKKTIENTSTSHIRTSMAWLNPLRISPDVATDEENFMIRAKLLGAAERFGILADPPADESLILPFALAGAGENIEAYKISSVQIWNPFVRVNSAGQPVLDSDGDGLPDSDEAAKGMNPSNARTNGRCLDSLTARGLCPATLSCDGNLDADSDGLNACEELILGTNLSDFDTDGDGVPDGIEYALSSDPKVSDLDKDINNDQIMNIKNIIAGVHPAVGLGSVDEVYKSSYKLEFVDYVQQQPNSPRTGNYIFEITNIPFSTPLVNETTPLYVNSAHSVKTPLQLIGGAHGEGWVQGYALIRIDNTMHNGDVHWGYIPFSLRQGADMPNISLDQLIYFRPPDPQKASVL